MERHKYHPRIQKFGEACTEASGFLKSQCYADEDVVIADQTIEHAFTLFQRALEKHEIKNPTSEVQNHGSN